MAAPEKLSMRKVVTQRPVLAIVAALIISSASLLAAGPSSTQGEDAVLPAKPTGLSGTVAHDSVTLSWDDPANDSITGYQILRRDRAIHDLGDFQVHVDDTGSAATSYVDTGVEAEARYVYRIKARNANGLSPESNFFNAYLSTPPVETELVSNTEQTHDITTGATVGASGANNLTQAQGFTTGNAEDGYTLSSVEIYLKDLGGTDTVTVSVYSSTNSGVPDNSEYTLTNPSSILLSALNTFTAPAGATLSKNGTYFVVVEAGTGAFTVGVTTTDSEDSGKASGWDINDSRHWKNSASGTWQTSDSALRVAVNSTPNNAATGAPTISGAAQVGQTMAASTSDIADDDGLTRPTYAYQWIAVDNGAETDIGTDRSTYTPVAADEGKTIKVEVTFDDDDGNEEKLESAETATVAAAGSVLVSDLGQPKNWPGQIALYVEAQGFLTGSNAAGYSMTSLELYFYRFTPGTDRDDVTVSLRAEDSGGDYPTATDLAVFTNPSAKDFKTSGYKTFALPTPYRLTANTDYYVVIQVNPGGMYIGHTFSGAEDAGGATEWSIHDASRFIFNTRWVTQGYVYQIRVNGTADFTPPSMEDATVPANGTSLVLTLNEDLARQERLPPVSAFQVSADSVPVNVSAVSASGKTATLNLSAPILMDQTVTVSYTDPTTGDDTTAIQDVAGNDAASFTTGADGAPAVTNNSTQIADNTPAMGAPTISGAATVGQTLTASTSGISDADGLTSPTYSYQWIRNDGATDTDITGATDSTYTLVADDEGKTIKVRVSFMDDAANEESLTSTETETVSQLQIANSPATGAPSISGTAQVGETLTGDASGIVDENGLENATYSYQWIRNDGDDDADITGATSSAYTLVDADKGKTLKVQVTFTDDADNSETLTSAATNTVAGPPLTASFEEVPESHDGQTAFTVELRFSESPDLSYKDVRDDVLTITDGDVVSARRLERPSNTRWELEVSPDSDSDVTLTLPATTDCSGDGAICTGDGRKLSAGLSLNIPGPPNNIAAGAPVITGTTQVGQTLEADTTGIADADGLTNVSYSFQWIRNDGANDADISGATSSTYTLVDTDEGKTIQVVASFTDDAGNDETLTSAATASVEAASGDPRNGATDLGDITETSSTTYSSLQTLDGEDETTDWYTFTLTAQKRVQLGLRQLDADATLMLEDQDGDTIRTRSAVDSNRVSFTETLQAGTYYVRVDALEVAQNNYKLSWKAS